nr:hypothetical protein [Tanacetum cinerariifolium]
MAISRQKVQRYWSKPSTDCRPFTTEPVSAAASVSAVCAKLPVSSLPHVESLKMEQPNPTFAKILILDTGKFEQWKFKIQQYLQNEHYAIWEVIEFGDSYEAPQKESGTGSESESSAKNKGRAVAITTEDMQKRRNDVKARTTL